MKRRFFLLIICIVLTLSVLVLASCGKASDKASAGDGSSSSAEQNGNSSGADENTKPNENGNKDENGDDSHTHSYGKWVITEYPTCDKEGSRERVCSCGRKQVEPLTASHSYTSYETVKFCSGCGAINVSSPLDFPPALSSSAKTTVTLEEWIKAFDLTSLNSFTMTYSDDLYSMNSYMYGDAAVNAPQYIGYEIDRDATSATVKYKDGEIYFVGQGISKSNYDANSEYRTANSGGAIEFDEFRAIDRFTNSLAVSIQPAEILDDSVYDLENYGFDAAVYSEETRSYRIDLRDLYEVGESISAFMDVCFENGNLKGCRFLLSGSEELGEFRYQEAIMIFSDINTLEKVSDSDCADMLAEYPTVKATVDTAAGWTKYPYYEPQTGYAMQPGDLSDILNLFRVDSVEFYTTESDDGYTYVKYKGVAVDVDGTHAQKAEDIMNVILDSETRIIEVSFTVNDYVGTDPAKYQHKYTVSYGAK